MTGPYRTGLHMIVIIRLNAPTRLGWGRFLGEPTRKKVIGVPALKKRCLEIFMRPDWMLSLCGVVLAFLGTQHHNLMMLLFAFGLSNVGMSLMTKMPLVRDAMLIMSLAIAAVISYQISRPQRPVAMRVTGALSILITLGIAGWSFLRFGL